MRGFTLVELSIVLVIIGLIIGSILVAQSMIQTAKIRSQVRQLEQFDIAATNFLMAYKQLPGDSNLFRVPRQGSAATDNGNNNGTLYPTWITRRTCSIYYSHEHMIYFAQLSLSGMLSTQYLSAVGQSINTAGISFPQSPLSGGNIFVWDNNFVNGASEIYYYVSGPKKMPGGHIGSLTGHAHSTSGMQYMTPAEASSLDNKIDDGIANSGKVFAATWWNDGTNNQCASPGYYPFPRDNGSNSWGGCNLTTDLSKYNLSSYARRCRMGIKAMINR